MRTITVRNAAELAAALAAEGLRPTRVPRLPFEIAGTRFEWQTVCHWDPATAAYVWDVLVPAFSIPCALMAWLSATNRNDTYALFMPQAVGFCCQPILSLHASDEALAAVRDTMFSFASQAISGSLVG